MGLFKHLSLRTKIVSSVMIAVLLVAAGAFASIWSMEKSYKKTIADSFADNAREFGLKIATQYYERYGDVQAFAVNATVKSMDAKSMSEVLDQYVALYGIYDLILVVDIEGRPVASNLKDTASKDINVKALRELNYASANWFKAVMAGETTDDKDKGYAGTYVEDFISDPILKVALGDQRFGSSFSTAIKDSSGKIIGVITNRTNSRWFESDFKPFYESLKDQELPTSQLMILNRRGNVVAAYDPIDTAGKLDVQHDPKIVLKENPASAGYAPAIEAAAGKSGSMIAADINKPTSKQVIGYNVIDNFKWPKSLGWTVYVSADEDDAFIEIEHALKAFYIGFAVCLLLSLLTGYWVAQTISKSIATVTATMSSNAAEVAQASQTIASSAVQLSESATQQAAALQETVAAVDEISAMVEKNADAAQRSKEVSVQSREAAERGRGIVENMINAIGEIDNANEEISNQMQASNRELSEITTLINDIGSKTKVINEIVFQTKLLSFNASVEAARAGEYGKGFAVVAEEVGNLAEMSGSAAKEISSLLEASVRKVEAIVDQTKDKVDRLTSLAKEKVKTGSEVAKECNTALEEILENVQSVDTLVAEIAVASNEQSTGIREISKAVGQMEQVTQQNSVVAQSSSSSASELSSQSTELNSLVQDLSEVVTGSRVIQKTAHSTNRKNSSTPPPKKVVDLQRHREEKRTPKSDEIEFKMASSDSTPSSHDSGFED